MRFTLVVVIMRIVRDRHLALLALISAISLGCQGTPADLAITHVTVIDPASGDVTEEQTVVVSDGVIQSVQPSREEAPPARAVADGSGRYLMPGLWDMHVHLDMHEDTDLTMLVVHGVLNVRDMGGDPFKLADLKARIDRGELLGPTIRGAGAIVEDRAWLARARTVFPDLEHRLPVDNPEEARATIRLLASWGVDLIKVRNLTDAETLAAILAAARAEGLTVAGHEPLVVDIDEAAALGMTTFEHVPFITLTMPGKEADDARLTDAIETLLDHEAYIDPTLIASNGLGKSREERAARIERPDERYRYLPESVREQWVESLEGDAGPLPWGPMRDRSIEMIRQMHAAGVPLLAGTDMGVPLTFPGSSLHDELELLVEQVGLSPLAALQAATSVPAALFEASEGAVAPGMGANLVLLDANPLTDIRNTRTIAAVVLRGELFERPRLDTLLDHVRDTKDAPSGPSLFERLEASCRANETPECLEKLAGYMFSRGRYGDALATYRQAREAGAGLMAIEGALASTVNLRFAGELECADVVSVVSELLAAYPDSPNKTAGVLDRVLPTLSPGCEEEERHYLEQLAALDVAELTDEMASIYHQHYASYLLKVEGDPDAAFEYRRAHMPDGWQENTLQIQQLAAWCLEQRVALPQARELAQRAAEVASTDLVSLQAMMLEARIASAHGDHQDAVDIMETIDRAVPDNRTVKGLLESFRSLAAESRG